MSQFAVDFDVNRSLTVSSFDAVQVCFCHTYCLKEEQVRKTAFGRERDILWTAGSSI